MWSFCGTNKHQSKIVHISPDHQSIPTCKASSLSLHLNSFLSFSSLIRRFLKVAATTTTNQTHVRNAFFCNKMRRETLPFIFCISFGTRLNAAMKKANHISVHFRHSFLIATISCYCGLTDILSGARCSRVCEVPI